MKLGVIGLKLLAATGGAVATALCILAWWLHMELIPRDDAPLSLLRVFFLIALLIVGVVVVTALVIRRIWAAPLWRIIASAGRISEDQNAGPVEASGADELALLAHAVNRMRRRMTRHIQTVDHQRMVLAALLEQLHEGVIAADPFGRIVLMNPAAIRLLNLNRDDEASPEKFVGATLEERIPHHDVLRLLSGRPAHIGAADDEQHESGENEAHFEIEGPAGVQHLFARADRLAFAGDGDPAHTGRFLIISDMTELSTALQMKADFVANASHELRTPLSTIRAAVETLVHLDLAQETEDARRFIELIDRHSIRLVELVSDLLDLARIESPLARHVAASLNAAEILNDLRDRFETQLSRKQIELRTAALGEEQRLVASPYLIQLILDNLIDNAIKFSAEGGDVFVAIRANPTQFTLEVVDQGCGIPPADRRRVFERFYQVERARAGIRRGTGLGLSIVKNAVAALRGSISLESHVGKGTRVTVTAPQGILAEESAAEGRSSSLDL